MRQTILGSGGAIGIPLARELKNYTSEIRLVSRNPQKVNETDELFPADLNDPAQVKRAIEGSSIVYVTVGFVYNLKVWQQSWPQFMKAVLEACQQYGAKLVFFDNVYMYDKAAISFMTEDAPLNPPSKKGLVRTAVFEMITSAVANEKLTALVARAADFYGPDNKNSALGKMVVNNFLAGKKAQSFGKPEMVHTYTYTPDAAKATALLGNTEDVWNQVWHLPTTKELITGQQWIELFAKEMGIEPKTQHISNWMLRLLGLFIPVMREFPEMMYQYEQDYIFDSTKFERRFGWGATPPAEGVKITLEQTKSL